MKHLLMSLMAASMLMACGGTDVGADEKLLIGEWQQSGEVLSGGGDISLENGRVVYKRDGTSRYTADFVITDPGVPEDAKRYDMVADVTWTLEETVLTRTLSQITLTPKTSTPQSDDLAAQFQQGLRQSPPVRYIVESVSEDQLALLDPESGNTLLYTR